MNAHTLGVLEFHKVLGILAELGCTEWFGQEMLQHYESMFFKDPGSAEEHYRALGSLERLISHPKFTGIRMVPDPRQIIERLEPEGVVLDLDDLGILTIFLNASVQAGGILDPDFLREEMDLEPLDLDQLSGFLEPCRRLSGLYRILSRYLDDSGRLMEDRIPELMRIQKTIQSTNQDILSTAKSFLSTRSHYTSDAPVYRDGRVLLPLRQDHRSQVDGIIHGTSDSGTTIYIEPAALLAQNNRLTEAKAEYARELQRILRTLSQSLRQELTLLREVLASWVEFDRVYIPARWMRQTEGIIPEFHDREFHLVGLKHPMLGRKAVPVTIGFQDKRIIVVTGPNTGGKTVALKSLGLAFLMARFGCPVPAEGPLRMPWINKVYADIGDEQSIEQNLSTFSAHLMNIARILSYADSDSLVLLDELGTGTDPNEGGALALAVIEELTERSCFAMLTSHHGIVKAFAAQHPMVENASMEFDEASKRPTFQLRYGIAGSSRALETAARVGFPSKVVERAKRYYDGDRNEVVGILERLSEMSREAEQRLQEAETVLAQNQRQRQELEARAERLEEETLRIREESLRKAEEFLADARQRIEKEISELRTKAGNLESLEEAAQKLRESVKVYSDTASDTRAELGGKKRKQRERKAALLKPGMEVKVRGSSRRAVLLEQRKDGRWLMAAGAIKFTLPSDELEAVDSSPAKPFYQAEEGSSTHFLVQAGATGAETPKVTLDLRGMRLDQALDQVRDQIDAATVHGLSFFGIIHGKGTGVLQAGIHQYLAGSGLIRHFHFALPEDGGSGKTIVYLRED